MTSQSDLILEHLKSGKTITPLEALKLYGSLRLGARIFELIKQGHQITAKLIELPNGKKVAEYRMIPAVHEPKPKAIVHSREPELFSFKENPMGEKVAI